MSLINKSITYFFAIFQGNNNIYFTQHPAMDAIENVNGLIRRDQPKNTNIDL